MIKWTFIKDIPNNQFRHIVLANNEGKPVTNSRDTQEVYFEQARSQSPRPRLRLASASPRLTLPRLTLPRLTLPRLALPRLTSPDLA